MLWEDKEASSENDVRKEGENKKGLEGISLEVEVLRNIRAVFSFETEEGKKENEKEISVN